MSVPKLTLTDSGGDMLTRAQAGETLTFTRLAMGDGKLTDIGQIPGLTGLIHEKVSVAITKRRRRGNRLTVSGQMVLPANIAEFRWREVGPFARIGNEPEKLFGYLNLYETGGTVRPDEGLERSLYVTMAVGNAEHVEVELSPISTPEVGDLTPVANDLTVLEGGDKLLVSDVSEGGTVKFVTVQTLADNHTHTWSKIKNKPSSFKPSAHTHTPGEAGAAPANHSHNWESIQSRPDTYPPEPHTHGAGDLSPFVKLLDVTATIARGDTSVDLANFSDTPVVDPAAYDALVVKLSGSLTNNSSSSEAFYCIGGGVYSPTFKTGYADGRISAGNSVAVNVILWLFATAPGTWSKNYTMKATSTSADIQTITNPLLLALSGGACHGSLQVEICGLRIQAKASSSGGGDDDLTPEIPPGGDTGETGDLGDDIVVEEPVL